MSRPCARSPSASRRSCDVRGCRRGEHRLPRGQPFLGERHGHRQEFFVVAVQTGMVHKAAWRPGQLTRWSPSRRPGVSSQPTSAITFRRCGARPVNSTWWPGFRVRRKADQHAQSAEIEELQPGELELEIAVDRGDHFERATQMTVRVDVHHALDPQPRRPADARDA